MRKLLRTNRIPIMLTDDELNAVDKFRFKHHVGTRAAAVRRLIVLGQRQAEQIATDRAAIRKGGQ